MVKRVEPAADIRVKMRHEPGRDIAYLGDKEVGEIFQHPTHFTAHAYLGRFWAGTTTETYGEAILAIERFLAEWSPTSTTR